MPNNESINTSKALFKNNLRTIVFPYRKYSHFMRCPVRYIIFHNCSLCILKTSALHFVVGDKTILFMSTDFSFIPLIVLAPALCHSYDFKCFLVLFDTIYN